MHLASHKLNYYGTRKHLIIESLRCKPDHFMCSAVKCVNDIHVETFTIISVCLPLGSQCLFRQSEKQLVKLVWPMKLQVMLSD